jgi:hypothetical protein
VLNISHLHYLESGQFVVRFLTDFDNSAELISQDPEFDALMSSLRQQSPFFNNALMQIQARAESEELLKLDGIRDRKIATFRTAFNVFKYTDDPNESAAFTKIATVLKTYKGVEKLNFEAESLAVSNFIGELRNAQFLPSLQILGLDSHLNNLETANENFKTLFSNRSTAIINTEVYDTKALRKNILDTYKEMAEYAYVMAKRKNTPFYINLLNVVNSGRAYYSDILARRIGTSKN